MAELIGQCLHCGGALLNGHVCPGKEKPMSPETIAQIEQIGRDAMNRVNNPPRPRMSRDSMLIEIARTVAKRSTCLRLQCGAVIEIDGRVLSTGYNGAPAGMPHCTPDICGPDKPCERTLHAEANAIAFAARHGVAIAGADLYATDSPCIHCAKIIINAGIKRVFYMRRYRDPKPLDYLLAAGVNSVHYAPKS